MIGFLVFHFIRLFKQTICFLKGNHMFVIKGKKQMVYECEHCSFLFAFIEANKLATTKDEA